MKEKLLVIDDEPAVRKLIRRVLQPMGYELIEASDGDQAAELVRRAHPALVLLDLHMPRVDGIAALDEILAIDSTLGVIMITGDSDVEQARLAIKRGACGYITKPFEPRNLEDSVAANLSIRSSAPGNDDNMAELGLLSPVIIHDLTNALSVILGMADVALKDATLPSSDLTDIRNAAARGQTILRNFTSLASMRRLTLVPCELQALIESVLSSAAGALAGSGIKLDSSRDRSPLVVMANRSHLRRLLQDLIDNAKVAMKDGGTLTLKTELVPRPGYRMPLVRVEIEDSGLGIPVEVLTRMRKPLASAGGPQDDPGVRLYICSAIALQHGGRLYVENKPEGGARVRLYLPVIDAHNSFEAKQERTQEGPS